MTRNDLFLLIFHALAGGLLALASASLALQFGGRSAERLPGESRRPHCVYCFKPLQWYEFFPLFGWLFRINSLQLPCPCGKRTKLWILPAVEISGFALGVAAVLIGGWTPRLIPLCLGLGVLPAIAAIDLAFRLIPNELNFALGLFGLIALGLQQTDFFLNLVGAAGLLGLGLLLALGYSKLRGREMLGLGDVKFFAAAGLWLPLILIPWFLMGAGVIGGLFGLIWRRAGGGHEFPFAPALCASLIGCIFFDMIHPLLF